MDEFQQKIALMIFGSWISIMISVAVLKSKVGRLESDIDNIGLILGTKKALGIKQKKDEEK